MTEPFRSPEALLTPEQLLFVEERHLATLTTLRPDGTPHVVPIGFSYDPASATVRIITRAGSRKVANARAGGRAAVCQVDRGRWLTLEGVVSVRDDEEGVALAVAGYTRRYQAPRPTTERRVALEIAVDRVLGR